MGHMIFFGIWVLFELTCLGIIVYLIVKRVEEKQKENFKKRDN
jgi:hypothetical protein